MRLYVDQAFCGALEPMVGIPEAELLVYLDDCDPIIISGDRLKYNQRKKNFTAKSGQPPAYSLVVNCKKQVLTFILRNTDLQDCVTNNPVKACVSIKDGPCLCAEETFAEKRDKKGRLIHLYYPCTYSISPASKFFSADGGSGSVRVRAPIACQWNAVSNADWIIIYYGESGTGSGTVSYLVEANYGDPREGTMTIAGRTFRVRQGSPLAGEWSGWVSSSRAGRQFGVRGNITTGNKISLNFTYGHRCENAKISGKVTLNPYRTIHVEGRATATFDCRDYRFIGDGEVNELYTTISGDWYAPAGDSGNFYLERQ